MRGGEGVKTDTASEIEIERRRDRERDIYERERENKKDTREGKHSGHEPIIIIKAIVRKNYPARTWASSPVAEQAAVASASFRG